MKKFGFTLVEILIVVAIIAILTGIFLTTNLTNTLKKGRDSKRKQDLSKLTRSLEDYYNDHIGYPPGDVDKGIILDAPWGGSFNPYIPALPADPLSPSRDYYYQTGPTLQNFFVIYAKLENTGDPDIERVGCQEGCGPGKAYNYYVASPNVVFLAGLPNMDITPPEGGLPGATEPPGGGGETIVPASPTPTPEGPSPTPEGGGEPQPTVTKPPGAECGLNTCCYHKMCGGDAAHGGIPCHDQEKCIYDSLLGWSCWYAEECP